MLQLIGVNLNSCQTNNSIKSYEVNVWLDYQIKYDYFIGGDRVLAPHNILFEVIKKSKDEIQFDSIRLRIDFKGDFIEIEDRKNKRPDSAKTSFNFMYPYDKFYYFKDILNSSNLSYLTSKIKNLQLYLICKKRMTALNTDNLNVHYIFIDTLISPNYSF